LTLACGSGACAAAGERGPSRADRPDGDHCRDGGELIIRWREDNHVLMTGPVATTFTGEIDLASSSAQRF